MIAVDVWYFRWFFLCYFNRSHFLFHSFSLLFIFEHSIQCVLHWLRCDIFVDSAYLPITKYIEIKLFTARNIDADDVLMLDLCFFLFLFFLRIFFLVNCLQHDKNVGWYSFRNFVLSFNGKIYRLIWCVTVLHVCSFNAKYFYSFEINAKVCMAFTSNKSQKSLEYWKCIRTVKII